MITLLPQMLWNSIKRSSVGIQLAAKLRVNQFSIYTPSLQECPVFKLSILFNNAPFKQEL